MNSEVIIQSVPTDLLLAALEDGVDASVLDFAATLDRKLEDVFHYSYGASAILDGEPQQNPIVVCVEGHNYYCNGDRKWILGNGHHRLAALLATMADEVLVLFTDSRDEYMWDKYTDPSSYMDDDFDES